MASLVCRRVSMWRLHQAERIVISIGRGAILEEVSWLVLRLCDLIFFYEEGITPHEFWNIATAGVSVNLFVDSEVQRGRT